MKLSAFSKLIKLISTDYFSQCSVGFKLTVDMELRENYIHLRYGSREEDYAYAGLRQAESYEDGITIYSGLIMQMVIPRSAFTHPEDQQTYYLFSVMKNIGKHRNPIFFFKVQPD
ncbi:MAG: hypothetical protein LBS84_09135 [Clostridiales bacterium]|nr:hypothetical protein [Clostridiales bacterium]